MGTDSHVSLTGNPFVTTTLALKLGQSDLDQYVFPFYAAIFSRMNVSAMALNVAVIESTQARCSVV